MLTDFDVTCPYCGERFNTLIDFSAQLENSNYIDAPEVQDYTYLEDCQVCCQPILFTPVIIEGELTNVITRQENE